MTEADWNRSTAPQGMLGSLGDRPSERKLRLFACACCRRVWDLLQDGRSRAAVAVSERYADGGASPEELLAAFRAALRADEANRGRAPKAAWLAAHPLTRGLAEATAWAARTEAGLRREGPTPGDPDEGARQADLLRDLFGPLPFRAVRIDPLWLRANYGVVVRLAGAAYAERHLPLGTLDSARLAVLADALEDAGCTDPELLCHLRGPGPHVRGCWVVDALLGRP